MRFQHRWVNVRKPGFLTCRVNHNRRDLTNRRVEVQVLEHLGAMRRSALDTVAAFATPAGVYGTGLEVAWWGSHLVMWPLGWMREGRSEEKSRLALQDLSPVKRGLLIGDVEAAGTPILLLHGIVDNNTVFTVLRRSLRRRGFGRIVTVNYGVLTEDVRSLAHMLATRVEQLCQETGYERVHVVGHSLGGLIARYYVQRLGGDARVHTLVMLGTPHSGTHVARPFPHPLVRQLRPGSDVINELAAPAFGCRTRFVSIYSDLDHVVLPRASARLEHPDLAVRNVLVHGVGHLSLPVHNRVVHEISATLAFLDESGGTVAQGATSIASQPGRVRRSTADGSGARARNSRTSNQ